MSGRQMGDVPPAVGNSFAVEIDLVSDSEGDEENVKVISTTIVRPSVQLDCPPLQENRRSKKVTSAPVQFPSTAEPTLLATAATVTAAAGCPPKVVEWSRCLVCNVGFLTVCRQRVETEKTQQQVRYILEQCMGVPRRKCTKVIKKILQESKKSDVGKESEAEGQAPVSLFCATHELMVIEANKLSEKVSKLLEVLEEKEKELRSTAETWISGTEPVEGIGLIVRNAVMRANRKNKSSAEEKAADVKPSAVPEAAEAPVTVKPVTVNNINKPPESCRSRTTSSNEGRRESPEVVEIKPPATAVHDREKPKVADDKVQTQPQVSQQSRGKPTVERPTADSSRNIKASDDVEMISEDSDDEDDDEDSDDDADGVTNSANYSGSTRFSGSTHNTNRFPQVPRTHATRNSRFEAPGTHKANGTFQCRQNHNDSGQQRPLENSYRLNSLSYSRGWRPRGKKQCPVCAKQFYYAKQRNFHYRRVHGDGIHYTCYICKHLYSTFYSLETHLTNLHDPAKPFECEQCGIRFGTKVRLQGHIQTHLRNAQLYNNNSVIRGRTQIHRSANTSFMSRNYRNHHHQQPSRFQTCTFCNKTVADSRSLMLHLEMIHGINAIIKCDRCAFTCESEQKLNQHIARVHRDADINLPPLSRNPPESTQSSSRGNQRQKRDNRKEKQKEKVYFHDCDSCGIDFDTRGELMRHKRSCGTFARL